jgi:hypothetical protein
MIQTFAFFLLTFLVFVSFAGGLFLAAYCIIARLRKKTNPKQLTRLKKNGDCFCCSGNLERRAAYCFTAYRLYAEDRGRKRKYT